MGDVQQPGPERRRAAPALEPVKRPQERVLGDVLGILIAHDPGRDAQHDLAMALDQALERPQVAGQRGTHELVVRSAHNPSRTPFLPAKLQVIRDRCNGKTAAMAIQTAAVGTRQGIAVWPNRRLVTLVLVTPAAEGVAEDRRPDPLDATPIGT